ncbi:hypothetical protein TRFO_36689 [Tritrichomonas foetus]|uniref:MatE family protein n=1 Tax=Tritrichomonas foetus TaxID=1144522 RepID=A0A1J4JDI4_9EUKA|nr:hypothetical protein TRFO_36689 [Tritrichomonas foetus]|eukprot:OHS97160.1 hypothetical protein TRFO_36689 [Tritrichomonas foetus]
MIFGRFSKETPKSFLLACPFIIYFISFALPPILILQSLTSIDPDHSREIGGVFAVFAQLMSISAALAGVIGQGLLSAGTHAFGSNNIKRLIHLFLWSLLIELVLGTLFSLSIVFFKKPIAKLFISDESEVEFAIKMIPIPFYSSVIQNITTVCMSFLIIIGKPLFAVVQVSTNVILLCSGCKILAHFLKNDPIKVMHVYNLADLSMLVVTALLMIIPIKFIVAKSKDTLTTHQDNLTKVLIEDSLA